jgi:glyoxylase-like metal-dependent hydrolase (beta-lactamase superfamily II)
MEIVTGINQIDGVQGNCFLVEREGLVLIDTGLPRSGKKILAYITGTLRRDPHDVHTIIITHYHADHTGNVAELRRATGAKVAIHAADADYLSGKSPAAPLKGIRGRVLGLLMFLWPCEHLDPDILLHDGDIIAGLRCIHVPGHTPGSIALLDPERRALFCGDALLTKDGNVSGPPPAATDNMPQAMESVKVLDRLDYDVLLSGHGIPLMPQARDKVAEFIRARS